jgi:glycosidase
MNYPVRNAILAFVKNKDSETFYNGVSELYASYPKEVCNSLMNLLGTHDTERILSVLADADIGELDNQTLASHKMSSDDRRRGVTLLKIASTLQYTVFGVPSLFYGDEVGIEGGHDPFCRFPFPWGREDGRLQVHYRKLGQIRKDHSAFRNGDLVFLERAEHFVAYTRENDKERILVLVNTGDKARNMSLSEPCVDLLDGKHYRDTVLVAPRSALILGGDGCV